MDMLQKDVAQLRSGKLTLNENAATFNKILERLDKFSYVHQRIQSQDAIIEVTEQKLSNCASIQLLNSLMEMYKVQIKEEREMALLQLEEKLQKEIAESTWREYVNPRLSAKVNWESFILLQKEVEEIKKFLETNVTQMCDAYNKDLKSEINKKVDRRFLERTVEPRINDNIQEVKEQLKVITSQISVLIEKPDDEDYDVQRPASAQEKLGTLGFEQVKKKRPGSAMGAYMEKNMNRATLRLGEYAVMRGQIKEISDKLNEFQENQNKFKKVQTRFDKQFQIQELKLGDFHSTVRMTEKRADQMLQDHNRLVTQLEASDIATAAANKSTLALRNQLAANLEKIKVDQRSKTARIVTLEAEAFELSQSYKHYREKQKEQINQLLKDIENKKDLSKELLALQDKASGMEKQQNSLLKYIEGEFKNLKGPIKHMMVQYKNEINALKDETIRLRDANRIQHYEEDQFTLLSTGPIKTVLHKSGSRKLTPHKLQRIANAKDNNESLPSENKLMLPRFSKQMGVMRGKSVTPRRSRKVSEISEDWEID